MIEERVALTYGPSGGVVGVYIHVCAIDDVREVGRREVLSVDVRRIGTSQATCEIEGDVAATVGVAIGVSDNANSRRRLWFVGEIFASCEHYRGREDKEIK